MRELRSLTDLAAAKYVREAHRSTRQEWFSKNSVINTFNLGIKSKMFPTDATDLLVDEAQDFTLTEIQQMIAYFGGNLKAVHFFGDDGQQIYEGIDDGGHRVSMKDLVSISRSVGGREPFCKILYDNYRLPPVIAEFVDQVEPYSQLSRRCHGEGVEKARLLIFNSINDALSAIAKVIRVRKGGVSNYLAAVICQSRRRCEDMFGTLCRMGVDNIRRVRGPLSDQWETYGDLDGPKTIEAISGVTNGNPWRVNVVVSTAFASKGLQYDDVFIVTSDFNAKGWSENVLHQMHVALTRTQGGLIVCYTPSENMGQVPRPFSLVRESKFKTTL